MTNPLAGWAVQAVSELPTLETKCKPTENLELRLGEHSLWLVYHWPNEIKTVFSLAYSLVGGFNISSFNQQRDLIFIRLETKEAKYEIEIKLQKMGPKSFHGPQA